MTYLRPRIPTSVVAWIIRIALIVSVVVITSWITPTGEGDHVSAIRQLQNERDSLLAVNRRLNIQNNALSRQGAELDSLDRQLAELRTRGYYPKRLYLRFLQRRSRDMNIDNRFILNVLKTESSFWSQLDGPFGEVGGFQILPETLKRYVCDVFDLPESEFRLEDYADVTTNTEWAYVLMIDMKFRKKRLVWNDWNGGWR